MIKTLNQFVLLPYIQIALLYVNSLHAVDPVCPFVLVPDGHAEQLFESRVMVYVFSAHASQLPLLPALIKDPGGQAGRKKWFE